MTNLIRRAVGKVTGTNKKMLSAWKGLFEGTDLFCVDVGGANDLQPHWQKVHSLANFISYEPDSRSFLKLQELKRRENRTNFNYIQSALSKTGGAKKFNLYNSPTGSTFFSFVNRDDVNDDLNFPDNDYIHPITPITLETETLAESLNRNSIARIHMIKLDIQGAELDVLMGLDEGRWNELLCCEMEVNFQDIYEGAATFESAKSEMVKRGFRLFDLRISRSFSARDKVTKRLLSQYFAVNDPIPSISGKVWEADHIYLRDVYWALKHFNNIQQLKRLIIVYCVYNFYFDAIYLCEKWVEAHPSSKREIDKMISQILAIHKFERFQLRATEKYLDSTNHQYWGQYMWVPYPGS